MLAHNLAFAWQTKQLRSWQQLHVDFGRVVGHMESIIAVGIAPASALRDAWGVFTL